MIAIIALALSCVSIIVSVISLILSLRRKESGSKELNKSGTVYCSNCCQPFDAAMKICPKCGMPKKRK